MIMANTPEALRPNHRTPPQASEVAPTDEIRTIMLNQVAWGAVFAGSAIALVMQIILNMIGLGVGLSTLDVAQGDTPSASSISVGAGIWFVVSGILAAGLGGYIAGRLSGKAARVPRAGSTLRRLRMGIAGRVPQLQCTKVTARIRVLPYNAGFGGSNPGQSSFAQQ
jgi:hypothetical protein